MSAIAVAADTRKTEITPARVPLGSPLYNRIAEFLIDEAALLDNFRIAEWGALLAEDLTYVAPLRVTKSLAEQANAIDYGSGHFNDNYVSIMTRIKRLTGTKSAWAEDPPSRTRRFASNIVVSKTDKEEEFDVVSYLLLTRNRYESPDFQILSAERRDRLRIDGGSFKLARREIIIDQSVLGMPNLAVFL